MCDNLARNTEVIEESKKRLENSASLPYILVDFTMFLWENFLEF